MEYRTIPHSGEKVSIIGLGMGSMHEASVDETERTVLEAIDAGINIMDFIPSKANAFEGYARALKIAAPGSLGCKLCIGRIRVDYKPEHCSTRILSSTRFA